jgi:putative oxidoreductase
MDLALFALHVTIGCLFAAHGAQKLFGWFGGSGLDATADMFDRIGLRPGRMHAPLAGMAEFGGGIALAFGLLTPFAAAVVIGVMVTAILTVHLPNGFLNTNQGYEFNLALIAIAFALAGAGPGDWSLDSAFGLDLTGAGWALGALAVGICGGAGAVASGKRYSRHGVRRSPYAHA